MIFRGSFRFEDALSESWSPVTVPRVTERRFNSRDRRVHLIGCAGAGMRALAEYGFDCGWRMTGSDAAPSARSTEALVRVGVHIATGHSETCLSEDLDEVVFSPAVPATNPERLAARTQGIREISYPQAIGELTRQIPSIAVTGTHGKSSTTAMLATILEGAGLLHGAICGAEDLVHRRHGWKLAVAGDWLVVEACEYRRHFLELSPRAAILLGIEPDHFDCYPTLEIAEAAYAEFVSRIGVDGLLVARTDCPSNRRAIERSCARSPVWFSGHIGDADWWADDIRQCPTSLKFRAFYRGNAEGEFEISVIGRHHVVNALAAIAMARTVGISASSIGESLARYRGLHRRLERLSDWKGVIRYDDYAHHPTAIRATIAGLQEVRPARRIVCVFQPHQVSRTEALHAEFAQALSAADFSLIVPVYGAREADSPVLSETSRRLANSICETGNAEFSPSLDHAVISLETACRSGDVLLTVGAGDIDRLHHGITRRLS